MSKIISSHNLSEFDCIIHNLEKGLFLSKIVLDKALDLQTFSKEMDLVFSILYDSFSNLDIAVIDLKLLDSCIRSETDLNADIKEGFSDD